VRVKPATAQPKRPVHRKARSGYEQPFIDPEDFTVRAVARSGTGVKEDGMGGFSDLMCAIREDKNKDRDGAVRRTEFDVGVPAAELEDDGRVRLRAFILANTSVGHKYMMASGGQGIVYADNRGRAVKCAIKDLGDGELLWLARQKGWEPEVREPTADPGYRKPVTEEVEEDSEAPFDRGVESLDERRKLLKPGDRKNLEQSIWRRIGHLRTQGVLVVKLTDKLAAVAGIGRKGKNVDLKDVADAMIIRLAKHMGVGGMVPDLSEDTDEVFDFIIENGIAVLDERTSHFLARDLSSGIQQVVYAYAQNATKADGVDARKASDAATTMTPVIISYLVKFLGKKPVDDHIHLVSIILRAAQEAAKDVLGISGRPDRGGADIVDMATRRLVDYSGGRAARMSKLALKKLKKARTLNDVGEAFQSSA